MTLRRTASCCPTNTLLAKAFPKASIAGLDLDVVSIGAASAYAAEAGLGERIEFLQTPIEALPKEPRWNLISSFDVMHDLPDPLGAMQHIRAAASSFFALGMAPKADSIE